ncbi:NfeD family protein [Desulfocicer niacini]
MFQIKAWYWLVFAMILIMSELIIPSFTIIWFGLGAIIVAGLLWMVPDLAPSFQLFFWAMASIIFTILWFKVFKAKMGDRTKAGISLEAVLGESGLVVKPAETGKRGMVQFTTPVLGSEQWSFICQEETHTGDRVRVVDISGNTLIVKPIKEI